MPTLLQPTNMSTKWKRSCDKCKWDKKKKDQKNKARQPSKKEKEGVPPCADGLSKGLGFRRHKGGKCDPALQKAALDKLSQERVNQWSKEIQGVLSPDHVGWQEQEKRR